MILKPHQSRIALFIALAVVLSAFVVSSGFVSAQTRDCPVRVTLLQVNDVYQFAPVDGGTRGGIARVATLRKQVVAESPHTLFLLAGDTISPSIESNTYKGAQMIEAWNAAGLDYATFGNHEFDFGPDVLRQRMSESKFKWLAANVLDKTTGRLFADTSEFVVREFDGVKIGLFGILLPETLQTSRPGPNVDIIDPCTAAARVVPKIHAAGAQVVVALTHLSMAEDKQLARCSGVDVIIGGHEHTLLESMAGHAPILQDDCRRARARTHRSEHQSRDRKIRKHRLASYSSNEGHARRCELRRDQREVWRTFEESGAADRQHGC
jgi:5'-nucleotidase